MHEALCNKKNVLDGNKEVGALEASSSASRSVEVAIRDKCGNFHRYVIEANR